VENNKDNGRTRPRVIRVKQ